MAVDAGIGLGYLLGAVGSALGFFIQAVNLVLGFLDVLLGYQQSFFFPYTMGRKNVYDNF